LDSLTHSLVGAILGRAGLKRLTPYAMPALILSANLPDADSFVARWAGAEPIAVHRGFTHGVGGLVVLPILVTAIFLLWEKLRASKEGPIRPWAMLLVAFLGTLSHPLLDFMNTYGVRFLEPLSHRWFYADTLFIMEPWIWLTLILGLELSWRAERRGRDWTRPAQWAGGAVLAYIAVNFAISARAEALAARELARADLQAELIVASPPPLLFWQRRVVWRGDGVGGGGDYDLLKGLNHFALDPRIVPLNLDDPRLAAALKRDPHVRAFYFWSRMPIVSIDHGRASLGDQRYSGGGRGRAVFLIPLDSVAPAP
jgi:inner membrane protein